MDNSRNAGFGEDQLAWLDTVLKEDVTDKNVRAVVVGMHRALPNSLACGYSMNGDPHSSAEDNRKSTESGRTAYKYLWQFQNTTGKGVYVLASHSHFFMENIFDTPYWNNRNEKTPDILKTENERQETTLNGWPIGTAGAIRYRLPDSLPATTPAITVAMCMDIFSGRSRRMARLHSISSKSRRIASPRTLRRNMVSSL
jgi:hypothetical protein